VKGIHDWYDHSSVEGYKPATHYILAAAQPVDGIVEYPQGTLGGPAAGITYYEGRAHTSGPATIRFSLGHGLAVRTARLWLVIRNSDVTAGTRAQIERALAGEYRQTGAPRRFTNLTIRLYSARAG
jgi:hypothetical protein